MAHAAIQPLPSIGLDYGRFERQLSVSLGPQLSREDPRRLTFSYTNDVAWLAEGEPLSLWNTPYGVPRQCFRSVSATLRGPLATLWHNA